MEHIRQLVEAFKLQELLLQHGNSIRTWGLVIEANQDFNMVF
jgi:hypothetical protein